MLEFCKLILEKVSFDDRLFEKELKKSFTYLMPDESKQLLEWVSLHFGEKYSDIISDIQRFL
ncbi:MAG: hypothetical protein ACJ75J_16105 [Cytophagaceae bacterium]